MTRTFKEEMPLISRYLSPRYQPFYCNQLASHFIPRYVDAIYSQPRNQHPVVNSPSLPLVPPLTPLSPSPAMCCFCCAVVR